MKCIRCNSEHIQKDGNHNGFQRYKCMDCKKRFDGEKYEGNNEYIIHFNTKILKSDRNSISRENYCIPTKDLDYKTKENIRIGTTFYNKTKKVPLMIPECYCIIPNEIFEDCEHYTEEYVKKHYENCMKNFDLNMNFFNKLNYDEFNNSLLKFTKKHKFIEVYDLKQLSDKSGIYILVLDKYKQVYIGKSNSAKGIKGRILAHWSKRKEFGRLLNGSVDTSILSIDSFGALDTSRIFYKELKWFQNIDEYEEKFVKDFKSKYMLNRVAGGLNAEDSSALRNLELINSIRYRDFE